MQGLRQRILAATSEAEVIKLLEVGKTYEFASVSTRNSWKNAGRRALKQKPVAPVDVVEELEEASPTKKYRKRKK